MSEMIQMRLPRSLIDDLQSVVFKHDAQFLETVCRQLNLPFREAKIKILGVGTDVQLTLCDELSTVDSQCGIWTLNRKTNHYRQCWGRRLPGSQFCDCHSALHSIRGEFATQDMLKDMRKLEWIYHKEQKRHYLLDSVKGTIFTAEDQPVAGTVWTAPNGKNYLLYRGVKKVE